MKKIPKELQALANKLSEDPKDVLTINALADWIEEKHGDASPVREILMGDGDVIILGYEGEDLSHSQQEQYDKVVKKILEVYTAKNITAGVFYMPKSTSIRQIKLQRKGE